VLSFEGETCPYVQYTVARCNSVIAKCGELGEFNSVTMNDDEYGVIAELGKFEEVVKSSAEKYEPSLVTRYALDLATAFNKFYMNCKIAVPEQDVKNFRLAITKAVKITLTNALTLLGIQTVEQM
jgi:arginyl-tRNA synthetase